jgi:NTE family protein
MKVGLVMGAGGVLGGAWLTGGLDALARETRWDPGSAEYIVGTSAGSMIGALIAAGVPAWFMVAHARRGLRRTHRARWPPGSGRGPRGRSRLRGPSRPAGHRTWLAPDGLHGAPQPAASHPASDARRLDTGGFISTDSLKDVVRRAVPDEWVDHPNYWAVACDYESGRRIPFGRLDSPQVEIAEAIAASCAIAGFYRPVRIGGRRYVDGGVCSVSNLDVVAGRGLDLVICVNPLTSPDRAAGLLDLLPALTDGAGRRRLAHE